MCECVCDSLCVYTCRRVCSTACVCWESWPFRPHSHTIKGTPPPPSKERGTKMTGTLHFLWGLSPTCLCTSTKPSHHCFKVHFVSLSWLGRFILACVPISLPVPVSLASVCPDSSLYGALLLYCLSQTPLPPLTLCCQSQLLLLLHHPLQADRKVSFCQTRHFLPAREEGARARPWGASMLPSPCSYPNSVPNPN